jgi:pyridoxal biosynthesis lyase PdxS
MRQENIDASNKQIQVQADTNNSIRNNTEAVNRVADNVNNLLTKHEALEGRVLAIEKHNIAVDAEIKRIDNRAQQAFNRHDDRKKDIEKLEVAIAGLRA